MEKAGRPALMQNQSRHSIAPHEENGKFLLSISYTYRLFGTSANTNAYSYIIIVS